MSTWARFIVTVIQAALAAGGGCAGCSLGSSVPYVAPTQTTEAAANPVAVGSVGQSQVPTQTVTIGAQPTVNVASPAAPAATAPAAGL